MIELIVGMAILGIALVVGGIAFGAVSGAETSQAAGELSTAVRYTYNLAAINNKTYALFLDLDNNTYKVGPIDTTNECDRLLLNLDGGDSEPLVKTYGDTGSSEDEDDENPSGMFDAVRVGNDKGPPAWTSDNGTAIGKMKQFSKGMHGEPEKEVSDSVAKTTAKRIISSRRNELEKPRKLPKDVKFGGIVLKEDGDPVTQGVVPILFFPHGYTQRALIYVKGGDGDDAEVLTVEVMTLQGTGKIHGGALDTSAFREEVE